MGLALERYHDYNLFRFETRKGQQGNNIETLQLLTLFLWKVNQRDDEESVGLCFCVYCEEKEKNKRDWTRLCYKGIVR